MFIQKQKEDFWRDITALGGAWLYFATVLILLAVEQTKIAAEIFAGFLITYFTAVIIRLFYFKNRPKKETYNNTLEKIDASSFPSVHSARAVFLALTFSKFSDATMTSAILFLLAGTVCYSRIAIKKHYWTDVIGGVVLGIVTFVIVGEIFSITMFL